MRRIGALLTVLAIVVAACAWYLFGRSGVEAASAVDADVTITCDAWTSVSADACCALGDAILGEGPPSHTFEMDDLAHLAITRPDFGLSSGCRVQYFLERYADDPAWTDEVACAGG
jgi:hypothetical protein